MSSMHALFCLLLIGVAFPCMVGCGGTGYQIIDGEPSYVIWNESVGRKVAKLNADAASFEVLRNSQYARDRDSVFFEGRLIPGADARSFQVLDSRLFAKDFMRVYVRGVPSAADPETFRHLHGPYGRDESKIFCGNVAMAVLNIEAFEVVDWEGMWQSSYDTKHFLFSYGESFEGIALSKENPAVTGRAWARDGIAYYYGPARVEDADYASFKVIDAFTASDNHAKYVGPFPEIAWPQRRKKILGLD